MPYKITEGFVCPSPCACACIGAIVEELERLRKEVERLKKFESNK